MGQNSTVVPTETQNTSSLKTEQVHHPISSPAGLVTPGNVLKVDAVSQGLKIKTDHSYIEISAYQPTVIRVRVDKRPLGRDFSYAVVTGPEKVITQWKEAADSIVFSTDSLEVVIGKKPFSVAFYTKDGKLINTDVPGMGTSWIGDQVTTYKQLQPDERFIGLGGKDRQPGQEGDGICELE